MGGLSREPEVEVYRLEKWRDKGFSGIDAALKEGEKDPVQAELGAAMRRIGELTMETELLWQRVGFPCSLLREGFIYGAWGRVGSYRLIGFEHDTSFIETFPLVESRPYS